MLMAFVLELLLHKKLRLVRCTGVAAVDQLSVPFSGRLRMLVELWLLVKIGAIGGV